MNSTGRAKLFSGAALAALLIGPPLLLWTLVASPLPTAGEMRQAIGLRWVSPALAQHLGASTAWLAWLYIASCIGIAAAAQVRHLTVRLPLPRIFAAQLNTLVAVLLVGSSLPGRHTVSLAPGPVALLAHHAPTVSSTTAAHPSWAYDVRPRDTLWDIAQDNLGDPLRWREIWHLNAGHAMADGSSFHDPNLIRGGWQLALPREIVNPSQHVVLHTAPVQLPSAPRAPHRAPVQEPVGALVAPSPQQAQPIPTAPSASPRAAAPSAHEHRFALPAGLGLGAGAAGVVALLARRRRAASRRRPTGRRLALPSGELAAAERSLHNSGNLDTAHAIAGALRLAATLSPATSDAILELVISSHAGIELQFRGQLLLPEPFLLIDSGYLLPREHLGAAYGASDAADPAPALVHVGEDARGSVYVNLEHLGAVALHGEAGPREQLVQRLLVELAGSPWTALVEIRTTETRHTAADLLDRIMVVDLASEVQRLAVLAAHTRAAVANAPATSLAALRWRQAEPPDGVSLVLARPEDPELDALLELAADPQTAVVAVITGPYGGLAGLSITPTELLLPDAVAAVTPAPAADLQQARQLINLTAAPDVRPEAEPYATVHEQTPPTAQEGEIVVRVLGPLQLDGPIAHLPPQLRDIVLYLALHRRGVSLDEMATALWPEQLRSEKTLRNRMHDLRRAIGGRVSLGPGWAFDETVTTDWAKFQAWAKGSLDERRRALDLVRGQPLRDVKSDWASLEGFEAEMEASIVDLALEVGGKLLAEGDPVGAMLAIRAGLRACPWEERLYQLAMRSAADRGAIGEVKTLYAELRTLLDIEEDAEPDPDTEATYQELLRAARRSAST
jgi:DNA-binding SARP family transcriptional activator